MKVCLQCELENADDAGVCQACGYDSFTATPPTEPENPNAKSKLAFLTTEREGKLTVLKCRTPEEAFLVAAELEAADILVTLPDDESLFQEFQTHGFVSIRVSADSYEAAKDLQAVIEPREWEERARQPLSIPMIIAAVGLGLMNCAGLIFLFHITITLEQKGYKRKAKAFAKWFVVGLALSFVLIGVFSSLYPNLF